MPVLSPSFICSVLAVLQHLTTYLWNIPLSMLLEVVTQGCTGIFLLLIVSASLPLCSTPTRNRRLLARRAAGSIWGNPCIALAHSPIFFLVCICNQGLKLVAWQSWGHQELLRSWCIQHQRRLPSVCAAQPRTSFCLLLSKWQSTKEKYWLPQMLPAALVQ